jgi:hypothetical protein
MHTRLTRPLRRPVCGPRCTACMCLRADMIDKAFTKYSGPDQRLDKQEVRVQWPCRC